MAITEIKENEFENATKEGFVIVDFYGSNCAPCKTLERTLEELDFEAPFINIVKLKIDETENIIEQQGITSVPTVFFMKDGEVLEKKLGFIPLNEMKEIVGKYMY
ncbi:MULTISPECIES: thioredoxin family protein [Paenibacillus]|uniref:Thioredoxin n=1 Tax=Paenibacillus tundrae TaxID=528187 RepID=A0ABT9W815_9BACL|nr:MULTISPECIES: thioredoxin family protein [Paenibacillus]MCG7378717.1 thioredoxin family protein [Paenibacillus sp. ACRSA]MDQ0169402.1 thioredoxin 1 [Paenibacillus tundrae]